MRSWAEHEKVLLPWGMMAVSCISQIVIVILMNYK